MSDVTDADREAAAKLLDSLEAIDRHPDLLGWRQRDIDRITSALAAARAEPRWQPIETAPKDGTVVMFSIPKKIPCIGRADDYWGGAHWLEKATHWQALPSPPVALKQVVDAALAGSAPTPQRTYEDGIRAVMGLLSKAGEKYQLVQLHWQDRRDITRTEFVAQGGFSNAESVNAWANELIKRRGKEMPDGWCPLLCTEGSSYFVMAAK